MSQRFKEGVRSVYSFMGETLVECPSCEACALSQEIAFSDLPGDLQESTQIRQTETGWFAPRKLSCTQCGFSRYWAERHILRGWRDGTDDYFGLPLWLRAECCGHLLWALNESHLGFIESFVSASLRERSQQGGQWSNSSLPSRLPGWMKLAKNRDPILKAISKLRAQLPSSTAKR